MSEECDHEWKFVDASFDHEFGTERVYYEECDKCGATQPVQERDDLRDDPPELER